MGIDSVIYGDTLNLDTGNKLSLDDIFNISSGEYLNLIYSAVSKKINDDIVNRKSTEINMYYFEDVYGADGVKAVHDYNPNDWYLTNQSLVLVYQQGSLGPNSSGILSYEIPLDSIKDKLKISESIIK